MADFKTHITTSTVLGVGYGAAGYFYGQLVIGTILGASIAGWVNAFLPAQTSDPDGGQRVDDEPFAGDLFDLDAFDRAA